MKIKFWIRVLVSLTILSLLFYKVGFVKPLSLILNLNYSFLAVLLLLQLTVVLIGILNIKVFLKAIKTKIPNFLLFKAYLLSWASSSFLPGKIGEFSLAYFLKKKFPMGKTTAVLMVDKIVSLVIMIIFGLIGVLYFFDFSAMLIFLGISTLILILMLSIFFSTKLRRIIKKFILRKYSYLFEGFMDSCRQISKSKKAIIINIFLTITRMIFIALCYYVAFLAIDPSFRINPFLIFFVSAVITLITFIPITIQGIGLKEGSAILLYSSVGISPELTLASHLLLLIIRYLYSALFFILIKV